MDDKGLPGKFYEEFTIGEEFTTPSRTITEADVVNFAGISGDFHPLHMDETYAQKSIHKGRIAHGSLVITIATGLLARLGLWESTAVANLGYEWKFQKAVKIGDTITVKLSIVDKKETKKKETGIIQRGIKIINQNGETVVSGGSPFLVKRKIV
ncbi:MAG: MaoC family dehydratase N-terminal domain-containing protein [Syntrophales bacterium]|jgi:acyl dehydratase|nr:MaoC family dehydratase N-terminal domain-containing protein [Syntrophales bacterium]